VTLYIVHGLGDDTEQLVIQHIISIAVTKCAASNMVERACRRLDE
jgi:hypothetical protein